MATLEHILISVLTPRLASIRDSWPSLLCCLFLTMSSGGQMQAQSMSRPASEISFEGLVDPQLTSNPSDFIIKTWGIRDGLPRTGITAIAQTPDGFLWLGLERGLARFDGSEFKLYSPTTYSNLVTRPVSTLFVDRKGALWIGSHGDGVSVMEKGRFKRMRTSSLINRDDIHQFAEDPNGVIWRASSNGIHYYEGDAAQSIHGAESLRATSYRVLCDSYSGRIFGCYWESAGTWHNDLFSHLKQAQSGQSVESNNFFKRQDGGIWFLSSNTSDYGALHRLLPTGMVTPPQSWPFDIPRYGIGAFLESRDRALWISVLKDAVYRIGADGTLERFDLGKGTTSSLFEDHDGSIWAGSQVSGLNRIRRRLFHSYPAATSASVHMLNTDHDGGVIFTQGEKAYHINHQGDLSPLGVHVHYGALLDRQGALWTGVSGGLAKWTWNGSNYEMDTLDRRRMFYSCHAIFESKSQDLWIGGGAGGIARLKRGDTVVMETHGDSATAYADAREGEVWIGFHSGKLLRSTNGELTKAHALPRFTKHIISSIHVEPDQSLWIATLGDGLFHWSHEKITQFTSAEGLPSDEVGGVVAIDNSLWLTTTRGVGRILKSQFADKRMDQITSVQCLVLGVEDGLPNLECSTSYFPAIHASENGTLWFATVEGISSLRPTSVPKNAINPKVYIEEMRIEDKPAEIGSEPIIVPPGPVRLSFSFTSITLNQPRQARFQYRLEGHDGDWVDAWNAREAHYTKPQPGLYRFSVRASDYSGGWSDPPAFVDIQIKPFIWQKREFQIGAGLVATVFVAMVAWFAARGVYLDRIQSLVRARAVEQERSRIAEDLHDRLGAQSTQIMFQSKALTEQAKQQGSSELNRVSEQIQETAQEMALSLDEIVWATDPAKDNLESSMAFFLSYAESYFKDTATRLRVDVPLGLESRQLSTESRYQIFLAVKEGLANVLKHAKASTVWLRIGLEEERIWIAIEDDGIGMPLPPSKGPRNGLSNIKRRIESIGGNVQYAANEQGGLVVRIVVPSFES